MPALQGLIERAVRQLSSGVYTTAQIDASLVEVFGPDTALIDDGTYFVARAVGGCDTLVGAGGWGKRRTLFGGDQTKRGVDPLLDPTRDPARLRAFYVHPGWARRGIASAIVAACFADIRAAGFSRVELLATLPGEPLYRRLGFTVIADHDVPMAGGLSLPCRVMGRSVPPEPARSARQGA